MANVSHISKIRRVTGSTKKGGNAKSTGEVDYDENGIPDQNKNQDSQLNPPAKPKKGPKRIPLREDERLEESFIDRIARQIGAGNDGPAGRWNLGDVESPFEDKQPAAEPSEAPSAFPEDPPIPVSPIDRKQLEDQINRLNRDAEQEARVDDANPDSVSIKGRSSEGRGTIRDRLAIERLSGTDWAAIFKTRLTEYSSERGSRIPYDRRLMSHPGLGRRIESRVQKKDVIPELNLAIDTSASMSKKELSIILGEIQNAMSVAKINVLNIYLWHSMVYASHTFTKVKSDDFNKVVEWMQTRWETGGTNIDKLYQKIVKDGKAKKFTIILTDGEVGDHTSGYLKTEFTKALDPKDTIFGAIYQTRAISYSAWQAYVKHLPGIKVPIFLDIDKFK